MENLLILQLLKSESNTLYKLAVSPEIHARASRDVFFATKLLNCYVQKGIRIFDAPLEEFDLHYGDANNLDFSSTADASSAETSSAETSSAGTSSGGPSFTTKLSHEKTTTGKKNTPLSDSNESNKKTEAYNWSKEEVLLSIATYKEHQLSFLDDNFSKTDAWQKVVQDMTSERTQQGLPAIDVKKCKTKMDSLKRRYKSLKDSKKKSGNQTITWPYYDEMDELFAEQPWVKPLSTAGSNILDEIDINPPTKRKKTMKDYCEQLLEERKKRDDVRNQQHKEKMETANKLADAVTQLAANLIQRRHD